MSPQIQDMSTGIYPTKWIEQNTTPVHGLKDINTSRLRRLIGEWKNLKVYGQKKEKREVTKAGRCE